MTDTGSEWVMFGSVLSVCFGAFSLMVGYRKGIWPVETYATRPWSSVSRLQRRWRTDYGRVNWLGLNVWRNKNVLRVDLNTASEVLETTSLLSEFQTVGAVQQKVRSAKWVLVVGLCSKGVSEERRWHELDAIWYDRRGTLAGLMNNGSWMSVRPACTWSVDELAQVDLHTRVH